jgi:hypothetical protein
MSQVLAREPELAEREAEEQEPVEREVALAAVVVLVED